MIALVDIDGVLADCSHRLPFIEGDNPNWPAFFDHMPADSLYITVGRLVCVLAASYDIIYVTGRPESHREVTEAWLSEKGLPPGKAMFMRATGDYRPDYKVKKELYKEWIIKGIGKADIAIEARARVVHMWRELGITCLQPREGNY